MAQQPFITLYDSSSVISPTFSGNLSFITEVNRVNSTEVIPSDLDISNWTINLPHRGLLGGYNLGQNLYISQDGKLSGSFFDGIDGFEIFGRFSNLSIKPNSILTTHIEQINKGVILPNISALEPTELTINNGRLEMVNRDTYLPKGNIYDMDTTGNTLLPHTAHAIIDGSPRNLTFDVLDGWVRGDMCSVVNGDTSDNIFIYNVNIYSSNTTFIVKPGEYFKMIYAGGNTFYVVKNFTIYRFVDTGYNFYRPDNPNFAAGFTQLKLTSGSGIQYKTKLSPDERMNIYRKKADGTTEELDETEKSLLAFDDEYGGTIGGGGGGGAGGGFSAGAFEMGLLNPSGGNSYPTVNGEYEEFELVKETKDDQGDIVSRKLITTIYADEERYETIANPDFITVDATNYDLFDNDDVPKDAGLKKFTVGGSDYPPFSIANVPGFGTVTVTGSGLLSMVNEPGITSQPAMSYTVGNAFMEDDSFIEIFDLAVVGSGEKSDNVELEGPNQELVVLHIDIIPGIEVTGNIFDYISMVGIAFTTISDGLSFNIVNATTHGDVEIFTNGFFRVTLSDSDFFYIETDSEYTIEINFNTPQINNPKYYHTLSNFTFVEQINKDEKERFYISGSRVGSNKVQLNFPLGQDFLVGDFSIKAGRYLNFRPNKAIGQPLNPYQYWYSDVGSGDIVLFSTEIRPLIDFRLLRIGGFSLYRNSVQASPPSDSVVVTKVFLASGVYDVPESSWVNIPIKDIVTQNQIGTLAVHYNGKIGYGATGQGKHPNSMRVRVEVKDKGSKDFQVGLYFTQRLSGPNPGDFPELNPATGLNDGIIADEDLDDIRDEESPILDTLPEFNIIPSNKESDGDYCPVDLQGADTTIDYTLVIDNVDVTPDYCAIANSLLRPIVYEPELQEYDGDYCPQNIDNYYDFPISFELKESSTGYCAPSLDLLNSMFGLDGVPPLTNKEFDGNYCPADITIYQTITPSTNKEFDGDYCPVDITIYQTITPSTNKEYDGDYCPQNAPYNLTTTVVDYCPLKASYVNGLYVVDYTLDTSLVSIEHCTLNSTLLTDLKTVDYTLDTSLVSIEHCTLSTTSLNNLKDVGYNLNTITTSIDYCDLDSQAKDSLYEIDYLLGESYSELSYCPPLVESIENEIDFTSSEDHDTLEFCPQDIAAYYTII